MRIPGFTAEAGLARGHIYLGRTDGAASAGGPNVVMPQLMPQLDFCYPLTYPCVQYSDGRIGYCTGIWCTKSGWEPGAGG
jgi:hypothetical protein